MKIEKEITKQKMETKNNNGNNQNGLQATVTFLNREQIDFLDKLSKDCFFKYGHKIPRAKILSELINLLIRLEIDFEKINLNDETLASGILRLVKKAKEANV